MASLFVSACDSVPKGKKARWAVLPALCSLKSSPCKCILVKHEALGAWHSLCSGALCPGLFPDYGHAMAGHMQILALSMLTQLQSFGQTAKGPQQQLNVCSSLCSQLLSIAQHHHAIVHPNHPAGPFFKRLNGVPRGSTPVLALTDMQSGRCLAAHGLCATFVLIAFLACSKHLNPDAILYYLPHFKEDIWPTV